MSDITPLERAVIDALLAGDDPRLRVLRVQWSRASVLERSFTGVGFYTSVAVPEDAPGLPGNESLHIGDVVVRMPTLRDGADMVLFIRDGRLAELEGVAIDAGWPDDESGFEVSYVSMPRPPLGAPFP